MRGRDSIWRRQIPAWSLARFVAFSAVMSITMIVAVWILINSTGYIGNFVVGCNGIDYFYTGRGFKQDYQDIIHNSTNSGRVNFTTMEVTQFSILSPRALYENGSKTDCKSISNAIFCLSKLYNKICKFRYAAHFSYDYVVGHQGIMCWNDDINQWDILY